MDAAASRRARWTLGASILAWAAMAGPALGWGSVGHRVAGRIAEPRLNPAARAAIRDLLEPGETLADASTWADEHRREHPEANTWHYINIPITEPRFDRKFIPRRGSAVEKIDEFRAVLKDPKAPRERRVEALRFLVHLVQDVHQPLHVGHRDDRGGNDLQVQFFGKARNLHSVWDSGLLGQVRRSEKERVGRINAMITRELDEAWSRGKPEEWANESLDIARVAYAMPGTGAPIRQGDRLDQAYLDANLPLAERRVAQAGVRLAFVLNDIWK